MEAYCVKCKAKREMETVTYTKAKNGRAMAQGFCPDCKTKMNKFGPTSWFEKFKEFFDGD